MLGCFTVTGPGCAVGARTEVYAGAVLRGVYEADRIIKLRQVHEIVERRR
jgi:hypothetical protein